MIASVLSARVCTYEVCLYVFINSYDIIVRALHANGDKHQMWFTCLNARVSTDKSCVVLVMGGWF